MGVVVIGSVVDICGVAVIADVCGVVYAVFASVVGFVDGQGEQSTVTASVVGQLPTDEHVDGFCVEHEVLGHLVEFKHSSHSVHCSCVNLSHGPQSDIFLRIALLL